MRVAVVGDVMLDRYWHLASAYSKPNPESPDGRAFSMQREVWKLGGAASVANIARGFGDDVTLYGTIGDDCEGARLGAMCVEAGIDRKLRRSLSRTTVKTRIVLDGCLMSDRYDIDTSDGRIGSLQGIVRHDVVIVQDYKRCGVGRGVVSHIRRVVGPDIPILVDPGRFVAPEHYEGATVIKANKPEAVAWSEYTEDSTSPPQHVANSMNAAVIVTNGGGPVSIYRPRETEVVGLPVEPVDVVDVCGAGDTVIAGLAHRVARGDDLVEACVFSIRMAGRQCRKVGCNQVLLSEGVAR